MVHIASPKTVPAEAITEHVSAHWLATRDNGSHAGFAGVLNFEAGAGEQLHRYPNSERAIVVLAGDATVLTVDGDRPAPQGTIIFAAHGIWHGLRASAGSRLTVLSVYGGSASSPTALLTDFPNGIEPTGDRPYFLNMRDVEEFPQHDPSRALFHMTASKFLDNSIGSTAIILGYAGYAPERGAHEFHRHPLADEFVYVLEGDGVHLYGDQEIPMKSGDFAHIPAGEWHGLRNGGATPLRVLFGFLGVGGWDQRGYELPNNGRNS